MSASLAGTIERHESMRGWFAFELYLHMQKNKDIWLLTADLGYKIFDHIRNDFSERFINMGASEQSLLDVSVGLALKGKIPFAYSITPFLIYRGFETIRTYINHEKINVKLIGSGRNDDYKYDGFSHDALDIANLFGDDQEGYPNFFNNLNHFWPKQKEEIPYVLNSMIKSDKPCFLSLRR